MALGFNPTDFFKTRAVVDPTSADPSVLRDDRLGTFMVSGQAIWSGGSLSVALAPKLTDATPPYSSRNLPNFDPMFDRTNAHTRALIKASVNLLGVNPEFLVYREMGHTQFGLNLTAGFGRALVGYLEWSGGRRADLFEQALADGQRTGVLPKSLAVRAGGARAFMNDLAIGATYATAIGVNLSLEYDYHQAGFSSADWRRWFDGGSTGASAFPSGALWFIRGYASDQQEPIARNSLFLRADWQDAFVQDCALTGFVATDLGDGSGLAQVTADYYVSPQWTIGALADVYFGTRRSDFGSLPKGVSVLFKVSRYF